MGHWHERYLVDPLERLLPLVPVRDTKGMKAVPELIVGRRQIAVEWTKVLERSPAE